MGARERNVVTMVTLSVVPDARGGSGRRGDDPDGSAPTMPARDTAWTARAVCTGADPDALFVTGAAQRDAARMCQACPVRLECLADALDHQIEYGVWGGMTERQRRAILKKSPEVTSWRAVLEEARAVATREVAS